MQQLHHAVFLLPGESRMNSSGRCPKFIYPSSYLSHLHRVDQVHTAKHLFGGVNLRQQMFPTPEAGKGLGRLIPRADLPSSSLLRSAGVTVLASLVTLVTILVTTSPLLFSRVYSPPLVMSPNHLKSAIKSRNFYPYIWG